MSSSGAPPLAHRTVSNIRLGATPSPAAQSGPASPHTPTRTATSAFGSPSSVRADEDVVVIELGSRFIRVGFAGEALPGVVLQLGPRQQRRMGDNRMWHVAYQDDWSTRENKVQWGEDHQLWENDLRDLDLRLVEDKLARLLREAFTKFLLVDSRPRRIALTTPTAMPLPLLSTILDTVFSRFQAPFVSLLSSAVMTAVAGGVRSALVVDLGWAETTITSVYEYREVRCSRTIRGAKLVLENLHNAIKELVAEQQATKINPAHGGRVISFDECEDIARRLLWCRRSCGASTDHSSDALPTVQEHDESEIGTAGGTRQREGVLLTLKSSRPPTNLYLPLYKLADVCEMSFLDLNYALASFDDHEMPVHMVLYQHLLQLPIDVRAVCMSRIIFTGGCSNILGLKERIFEEAATVLRDRGWEPVQRKTTEDSRTTTASRHAGSRVVPKETAAIERDGSREQDGVWHDAANAMQEMDPIEEQLRAGRERKSNVQGVLRCITSLGPWAGTSLVCQLKVPAMSTIDRDLWLLHGISGASRPGDVDVKTQQRQSIGPGGLLRATGGNSQPNWTLGTWGYA